MPNWFNADVTISHLDSSKMEKFEEFYEKHKDKLDKYDNDVGDLFSHTFAPLSRGEVNEDGHVWNYEVAHEEWGSKWGMGRIYSMYFHNDKLHIGYESAWCMPDKMFEQFHKQGYKVESTGYEPGCSFMSRFKNGKYECVDIETEDLRKFCDEHEEGWNEGCEDEEDEEGEIWNYVSNYCEYYFDNN